MATPAAVPVCAGLDMATLLRVTIMGKVGTSTMSNFTVGDTVKMSFLANPTPLYRFAEGNVVKDGIAPYTICPGDFSMTFGKKVLAHLGAPPVDELGVVGGFYFSMQKSRPVYDGAWVSSNPTDGSIGFPLAFHGVVPSSSFGGRFSLTYDRYTVPDINFPAGFGTYTTKGLVDSTFEVYNGWLPNVVLTCKLDSLKVAPAV